MEIKAFELPAGSNFTEEEKKGIGALGDYLKSQLEAIASGIKSTESVVEAAKSEFEKIGISGEKIKSLEDAMKKQGAEISAIKTSAPRDIGHKSVMDALMDVFKSEDFKSAKQDVLSGKAESTGEFNLKLDSSSVTDEDVLRTAPSTKIYSDASPRNAFVSLFRRYPVSKDKNRIMYNDASYTDNTGYVEEMAENNHVNTATLRAKYRELAKLGSVLPFSAEMAEDYGYFLSWAQGKAQQGILNKLDTLLWSGDGSDADNPTHIYGIKTSGATAFNAATAGVAGSVSNPNLADLILAAKMQAKVATNDAYMPDHVLISYASEFSLRTIKNTQGDYISVLPNGSLSVHGLIVVPTAKMGAKELLVTDSATLQLYDKRNISVEIERIPKTDSYNMWLWYRGQSLVTRPDAKANIYVADIDAAIAAISKA